MEGIIVFILLLILGILLLSGMAVVIGVPLSYLYDAIASWAYPAILNKSFDESAHMPWHIGACIVFVLLIIGWAVKSSVTVKKS